MQQRVSRRPDHARKTTLVCRSAPVMPQVLYHHELCNRLSTCWRYGVNQAFHLFGGVFRHSYGSPHSATPGLKATDSFNEITSARLTRVTVPSGGLYVVYYRFPKQMILNALPVVTQDQPFARQSNSNYDVCMLCARGIPKTRVRSVK